MGRQPNRKSVNCSIYPHHTANVIALMDSGSLIHFIASYKQKQESIGMVERQHTLYSFIPNIWFLEYPNAQRCFILNRYSMVNTLFA